MQPPPFLDIKLYCQSFLTCVGFELSFRYMSTYDVCSLKVIVSIIRFKSLAKVYFFSLVHPHFHVSIPLFLKFLEDMSPFCGATDTPISDFW